MLSKFVSSNTASSGTLPSNTITNPKEDLKGITTLSSVAYQGPTISTQSKVVKQGTEVTKDQVQAPSSQSTAPVQPPVAQSETQTPVSEPVVAPVSAPMPNVKSSIPYPSRRDNERRRDQANEQIKKFYEIFKDMSFEISFTDALILMPKFASTLKALIRNKEKLSEIARTPMNEHCSMVILSKLPKKHRNPSKFLIPCEFPGMDECLARCFLNTGRALIDVHKGELTLRIRNEAITYNLDQTSRYSANYNQMTANKIDVICEEYSQEVLGFSDTTVSGNPTPYDDPIVSTTSPTLTLFGDSDFLLFEKADAFLGLEVDPNSPEINSFYYDPEGDILLMEAILNSEPLPPLPNHEQYMPSFKKELKVCEAKTVKSSVDEPPEGINPEFCTHKILMEEDYKPVVQHQRRVNPKIHDVIKKEVEKLLDAGLIYPISDSPWEKTTFTCLYGTFAYRRMPFGLCNASGTFQRCMLAIFHDMVEKTMEVFMDDFSVFGSSFENYLSRLDKMLESFFFFSSITVQTSGSGNNLHWQWELILPVGTLNLATQSVSQTDFARYVKANDAVLRNIQSQGQSTQNQCQNVQNQLANLMDMVSKLLNSNIASPSGSGTLPSNTITYPKKDLKGITTRSDVAYQGPTIPTQFKVVKQGTEVTKDQVQTLSSQSTAPVQPLVIRSETQTLVSEPIVTPVNVLIPYPSRLDNERRRDQANEQ
nr:reverse transcriptase domain-containing protein [Tanacetum cinerariifolium]